MDERCGQKPCYDAFWPCFVQCPLQRFIESHIIQNIQIYSWGINLHHLLLPKLICPLKNNGRKTIFLSILEILLFFRVTC